MERRPVSTAGELIEAATAAGARFDVSGDSLRISAPHPLSDALVGELRRAKPDILRLLRAGDDPSATRYEWRNRYRARVIRWYGCGEREWCDAERLAYGELLNAWHRQQGAASVPGRCAGCGDDLAESGGLIVDCDGTRVHFDAVRGVDCLIAFGRCWRSAAVAGLQRLGIEPPHGFELL
jgi:hypothetical protein